MVFSGFGRFKTKIVGYLAAALAARFTFLEGEDTLAIASGAVAVVAALIEWYVTSNAVKATRDVQEKTGQVVDGVAGPKTNAAIEAISPVPGK